MNHTARSCSASTRAVALASTLASALAFLPLGCQKAQYVGPKGNQLVVNVDRMNIQDWSMLSDQVIQSMVTSGTLARLPNQPAGLLLNPVVNTTTQQFDTDAIMKKIRIALMNTGRVEVIMADDLFGGAEDRIAREAHVAPEIGFDARLAGALFGWLFLAPLLFYGISLLVSGALRLSMAFSRR